LDHLGEDKAAAAVETAIKIACGKLKSMQAGRMGYSTSEVGDLVAQYAVDNLK
jgi:3-isopropylmalate dehydrogenase